jgi:hypothetical protein
MLAVSSGLAPSTRAIAKKIGASTTFTKGPAMAILTSSMGLVGSDFRRATPPMGRIVMSWISMPNLCATREWPYSCNTTQTNKATMTSAVMRAFVRLPLRW